MSRTHTAPAPSPDHAQARLLSVTGAPTQATFHTYTSGRNTIRIRNHTSRGPGTLLAGATASPAALHVTLRALERLCTVSAVAREQAVSALPSGALLSRLAELLSAAHAPTRTTASRLVAALSRSESRHWRRPEQRPPRRVWPSDSIVYYTGVAIEPWGPERLETGLGGCRSSDANPPVPRPILLVAMCRLA